MDWARMPAYITETVDQELLPRHYQTNGRRLQNCWSQGFSGQQFTPLGQGGRAALLEDVAAIEMAVLIEVIVDRGVDGGKDLEGLYVPELGHRRFSSSERLV